MRSDDSINSERSRDGKREQLSHFQASLGIRMCVSDPRYMTHEGDSDRQDVIILMSEVRKLMSLKEQLDELVATVCLTTAEMGFSLTDEPHMVVHDHVMTFGRAGDRAGTRGVCAGHVAMAVAPQAAADDELENSLAGSKSVMMTTTLTCLSTGARKSKDIIIMTR